MLPSPYSQSTTFGDELSLRRSSLSYRSTLNDKLEFEFVSYSWSQDHFISSFLWLDVIADRLHLQETSRQNLSWSSSTFWALPGYQLNSWWEIPSLPLKDLCYHEQHYCLPSNTNLFMLWSSLLSRICSLPWSITIFYVKNVVRISPPLKNSWYR